MANSLAPGEFRTGQLIDGFDGTPYQSCSLSYEERIGAVLSIPYLDGVEQFSQTEAWFKRQPPESIMFHDNLGAVTLTGLRMRSRAGSPYALGQLRADVAVFGQPRELKAEFCFETMASRIDGLEDFASFNSVTSDIERTENGHRVTVLVEANDRFTCEYGGFKYAIRASTPWTATDGQSFSARAQALIETESVNGATANEHLTAQWPLRALLIMAYGRRLFWREHQIVDDQFPMWMLDGSTRTPSACNVLLRRTINDAEQPEPVRSDVRLPMFHLHFLGEAGLRKWLELYADPLFRRAIEPVVEVINGASRFLEPQVLMTVLGLDAMGHYRDEGRARNVALFRQIERCLRAAGVDFSSIGPVQGVAKAIANINNDLKHPDRDRRPDPVELSLVADLSIMAMRLQLFDLLDLPDDNRSQFESYGDVQHVISAFERNGLRIDDSGNFVARTAHSGE